MKKSDITRLKEWPRRIVLSDLVWRGQTVEVRRFTDPDTGQSFDLFEEGNSYRETAVPESEWDVVPFGPFKQLED